MELELASEGSAGLGGRAVDIAAVRHSSGGASNAGIALGGGIEHGSARAAGLCALDEASQAWQSAPRCRPHDQPSHFPMQ